MNRAGLKDLAGQLASSPDSDAAAERYFGLCAPQDIAAAKQRATQDLALASDAGVTILSASDAEYPDLLRATPDRPELLYVRGAWPSEPHKVVSIIGTRSPTSTATRSATLIAQFFGSTGWSVVSGLALGCDTAAHTGCLDAAGHTIAVLAHGLQTVAPRQNQRLADRIVDSGGLLLSEYPMGSEPVGYQFVERDRIQAALSRGVLMIQSSATGGSLHACRAAAKYGRPIVVVDPGVYGSGAKSEANNILASSDTAAIAQLLRVPLGLVPKIYVLSGRGEYPTIADTLAAP